MTTTEMYVRLGITLGFAAVCSGVGAWVLNKFCRSADKRMAEAAAAWLEHESVMADVLEDVARARPEVEGMVELNRARLVALQPIVRRIATQEPMSIREQWRASRDLKRIKRHDRRAS